MASTEYVCGDGHRWVTSQPWVACAWLDCAAPVWEQTQLTRRIANQRQELSRQAAEIERLRAAILQACVVMGDDMSEGNLPTRPTPDLFLIGQAAEWRQEWDEAERESAAKIERLLSIIEERDDQIRVGEEVRYEQAAELEGWRKFHEDYFGEPLTPSQIRERLGLSHPAAGGGPHAK